MDQVEDARDGAGFDSVVDSAVGGDRAALGVLLARVHPLIVRYCRSRLSAGHRSLSTADDVAQEVCMAVVTALPTYRRDGRPFLAFVYGIAAHKVVDAHRAAGRSKSIPVADVPETTSNDLGPEQNAVDASVAGTMASLLGTLPPTQQEILRLRVAVGLSAEETADALGMTAGAVRVAQHRALTKLRTVLESNHSLLEQVV
ncbi:RNA polymerase sigma-70 factor, ECF subfamily [Nakamurella panacisegetis]|uniref:RNA polymerase sigma-70 factor, ECF subfamily n=1 Tax=Nakamurella panacisegetis TaxID=1090615 RepID=A0A1H0P4U6_9ACTN|nr:sigma-70 family RNA polymerase sigma factor [Nakamurella panacisegetis]SDO99705.1 RNA polymerase sigma-70 factor, ECF subfamily [Nakamurella panacisegetis]